MTLLHLADFWHDWEHAARLSSTPGELVRYPLFATSHALSTKVVDSDTGLGRGLFLEKPLGLGGCDKALVIMAIAKINAKNRDDGCAGLVRYSVFGVSALENRRYRQINHFRKCQTLNGKHAYIHMHAQNPKPWKKRGRRWHRNDSSAKNNWKCMITLHAEWFFNCGVYIQQFCLLCLFCLFCLFTVVAFVVVLLFVFFFFLSFPFSFSNHFVFVLIVRLITLPKSSGRNWQKERYPRQHSTYFNLGQSLTCPGLGLITGTFFPPGFAK